MADESKLWKALEKIFNSEKEKIRNKNIIEQDADAELLMVGIMNATELAINVYQSQFNQGIFFLAGETCDREYSKEAIDLCADKLKNAFKKKYPQYRFEVAHQYFSNKNWSMQIKWEKIHPVK